MSRKSNQHVASTLELAPLVIYFLVYVLADILLPSDSQPIYIATAAFIVATLLAVLASFLTLGRLPIMPLASAIPLVFLGGVGVFLHDENFIKIRPTVINLIFAVTLLGGLAFRQALLRYAFGGLVDVSADGWRKLTLRWGLFCLFMAILNECVWRSLPEGIWIVYDAWISTGLTLVFTIAQYPLILAHGKS